MKINGKVLVSVSEADIINGKFRNKEVEEVADGCFYNLSSLVSVSLPNVKKIGSYCFSYNQALTEIALPALTTAGSDCFSYNQALTEIALPALTTAGSYCFSSNQALTEIALPALNVTLSVKDVDGFCFVITKQKSSKGIKIYTGYNLIEIRKKSIINEVCFVAEKDGFYAHGETVKKAISDVQFKIVAEKLKSEPITADTIVSVNHYRLVTGACEMGCNSWMRNNGITATEMKASELLPILEKTNAYGLQQFKKLITF